MSLTNHGYLGYAVIVNKKFWDGLLADVRTALDGAMKDATRLRQPNRREGKQTGERSQGFWQDHHLPRPRPNAPHSNSTDPGARQDGRPHWQRDRRHLQRNRLQPKASNTAIVRLA